MCATLPRRHGKKLPTPSTVPWQLLLLAAFVSAAYFTRLGALPFRGEETRWARVAWEMRETGDWIVPRQQGQVFADRPPLCSWLMLPASGLTGGLDRFSVRLPAALATLLTTLLLYGYCRQFLTRWGAFTAGLVYATFPQTLQLGRLAESDAVFAFLVTAALLVWHAGYARHWSRGWTWIAGYALAALAGLAKGPQGPVYFIATVAIFLTLRRDWRYLFSLGHLAGLTTLAAVLGAWQVPFSLAAGGEASAAVWSEEGTLSNRLAGIFGKTWWRHLASYPAEVFAYLLPWSVFLLAALRRRGWRSRPAINPKHEVRNPKQISITEIRNSKPQPAGWRARFGAFIFRALHLFRISGFGFRASHVVVPDGSGEPSYVGFLLVYLAVAFPTCWLVTEARPRHLMAVYPAVACLIAAVIDRSCFDRSATRWDWGFRWFLLGTGTVAAVLGAIVLIVGIYPAAPCVAAVFPPSASTAACGCAILALAATCLWAQAGSGPTRAAAGITAVGGALALGFVVLAINHFARIADDLDVQVARLKNDVLRGERLVSFGPLFHKFTFHYQNPIELLRWPTGEPPKEPPWRYFAFMERQTQIHGEIPFAWEEVAVLYCDRAREKGHNIVHVGRRPQGKLPACSCRCKTRLGMAVVPR